MIVLWDSSTMTVQLTLIDGSNQYEYVWEANRELARDMLAYMRDRLAEHQKTFTDITAIGTFRGPGSFTGLRIGLTVLNTIAGAQNIPIVGAIGEQWKAECITMLERGNNHKIVLPEYGSEARITTPKK